jgi:endonuclease/exonuclease/phosphatase (EEP) superfamily protein YafD
MKFRVLFSALLAASPLASLSAMPVSAFIEKADRLQKKGPLALFSGDLKLLTKQVKADFASLRSERLATKAAGKATAWCPPEKVAMTDKDVMAAMRAVPPSARTQTDTRGALRAMLVRRYPCKP